MLMLYEAFYQVLKVMTDKNEVEKEKQLLKMRENQFNYQQHFLKTSERARHDFRQNVRTIVELYDSGKLENLGDYLHEFEINVPQNENI